MRNSKNSHPLTLEKQDALLESVTQHFLLTDSRVSVTVGEFGHAFGSCDQTYSSGQKPTPVRVLRWVLGRLCSSQRLYLDRLQVRTMFKIFQVASRGGGACLKFQHLEGRWVSVSEANLT